MRKAIWIAASACLSNLSFAQTIKPPNTAMKKDYDRGSTPSLLQTFPTPNLYANVEFRHHTNTYYSRDGEQTKQEPSFHGRFTLGAKFYDGALDTYLTLGMIKQAETQQILQRKPEFAIDVTPIQTDYFSTVWYNTLQFPVKEADGENSDTTRSETYDDRSQHTDGTTYIVGLAAMLQAKLAAGSTLITPRFGLDGWTKMYSKKQFVSKEESVGRDDDPEPRYSLAPSKKNTDSPDQIEDTALHYAAQTFTGFSVTPGFLPALTMDIGAYYDNRFIPIYTVYESGVEHQYVIERTSHYRFRMQVELSPKWELTNDFYHFHNGLFQQKTYDDERRYRNILRLSYKM